MSVRNRFLLLLGMAGVAACTTAYEPDDASQPASADESATLEPVLVSTDRTGYAEGDAMIVAIVNQSAGDVRFTLCPGTWEHHVGDEWLRSEQLMSCSPDLTLARKGARVTETITVAVGLPSGEHRVVVHLYGPGDPAGYPAPREAVSNGFTITAARAPADSGS